MDPITAANAVVTPLGTIIVLTAGDAPEGETAETIARRSARQQPDGPSNTTSRSFYHRTADLTLLRIFFQEGQAQHRLCGQRHPAGPPGDAGHQRHQKK